jgi:gamma-glutamylcyclotransferase (GGCT)/AIG2-like uncharacterized protein YtfP
LDGAGRIPVQMFFYGTLKRGGSNHAYCRGGRMTAEATVEGLLYDLPQGYPALVVPEASVLAVGTDDPLGDAHAGNALDRPGLREPGRPAVHGELYTFDDPEDRLPSLDELEDFLPGDPSSPYRRLLLPVRLEGGGVIAAWAYAVRGPRGTHLPGGRWPAGQE